MNWFSMRRRMMAEKRKILITYNLTSMTAHSYIQLNGEGEEYCGSGEIEVKSGDFLLCYAYSGGGSSIEKDGIIVAESNTSVTYKFYPKEDSKIEAKTGTDVIGTQVLITTL